MALSCGAWFAPTGEQESRQEFFGPSTMFSSCKCCFWIRARLWPRSCLLAVAPGAGSAGEVRGGTAYRKGRQGLSRIWKHCEDEALSGLLRSKQTARKSFCWVTVTASMTLQFLSVAGIKPRSIPWLHIPRLDEQWKVPPAVGPRMFLQEILPLDLSSHHMISIEILTLMICSLLMAFWHSWFGLILL